MNLDTSARARTATSSSGAENAEYGSINVPTDTKKSDTKRLWSEISWREMNFEYLPWSERPIRKEPMAGEKPK